MAEIIVTSTADSGTGTLRAAIAAAQDGDVILFDADVFPVGATTSILLSSLMNISKAISIYGGFPDGQGGYTSGATITRYVIREIDGVETEVVVDDDHPAAEGEVVLMHVQTRIAIDGQATQDPNAADEWSGWTGARCFSRQYLDSDTEICGIAFINGLSESSEVSPLLHVDRTTEGTGTLIIRDCAFRNGINVNGYCGGVRVRNLAEPVFERCEFDGCKAKTNAGSVYAVASAKVTLTDCVFTNGTAGGASNKNGSGGGFYGYGTSQNTLNNCTFYGCSGSSGGAAYITGYSQNVFNDCVIANCAARASTAGGVCCCSYAEGTLNNCVIINCSAISYGGGVSAQQQGRVTLNGCRIINCQANYGGGTSVNNSAVSVLTDCVVTNCVANQFGGGLYSTGTSRYDIVNCTITNSSAIRGGAIAVNANNSAEITDCEITNCSATEQGGGFFINIAETCLLTRCSVSGCDSPKGGGLVVDSSGQVTLVRCVIDNNESTSDARRDVVIGGTNRKILNECTFGIVFIGSVAETIVDGGVTITKQICTSHTGENTTSITIVDGAALTITDAVIFVSGTTFTSEGRGYLAVASGINTSAATLTNVVACRYGAGISALRAYKSGSDAVLETTVENENVPFLIEIKNGDAWETVTTEGTTETTVPLTGIAKVFRVFDGVSFITNTAGVFPTWTVEAWAENLGGSGADQPAYSVKAWGVAPQIEHR